MVEALDLQEHPAPIDVDIPKTQGNKTTMRGGGARNPFAERHRNPNGKFIRSGHVLVAMCPHIGA